MAVAAKIPHPEGVGNALFVKKCDEIHKWTANDFASGCFLGKYLQQNNPGENHENAGIHLNGLCEAFAS